MIGKLLKKELRLCMHPMLPASLLLSALLLAPNYPYAIMYFYLTLGIFFTGLTRRENHDVLFTCMLPVKKEQIVTAQILFAVIAELLQMLIALPLFVLHRHLISVPNAAGMEANIVLLAEGFLIYGVFHLVYFVGLFRDTDKVGVNFLKAGAVVFLLIFAELACTYAVPFARDILDTPDPQYLGVKLLFALICLGLYCVFTIVSVKLAQKRFGNTDIR